MYKYEYSFIAHQGLSDDEVTRLIDNLCLVLKNAGASVLKREYWGFRDLAYKINKQEKGHYFMLCLEAEIGILSDFKQKLKLNELIMRYMELKKESISEDDSHMITAMSEEADGKKS